MHLDGGKIPDALNSCLHKFIGYPLGKGGRDGDDTDVYVPLPDDFPDIPAILHLHMVYHRAYDMRILIEESHQVEAQGHEVLIVG